MNERHLLTWDRLLSTDRSRLSESAKTEAELEPDHATESDLTDRRTEFEKDYHRVIISASFRRLQDKTQVFPLDQSDFIRTRLTHSLEVSSLAKSLGQSAMLKLAQEGDPHAPTATQQQKIADILLCTGLIHDIGNPPFGHYGETTIRDWFRQHLPTLQFNGVPLNKLLNPTMQADLEYYEGNAQALRLLSKLHYVVDENGMNLTFATLNTLTKYPIPSTEVDPTSEILERRKMGYLLAEKELFETMTTATGTGWFVDGKRGEVREEGAEEPGKERQLRIDFGEPRFVTCRHPLTYLLEAADDISYRTADIEDAYRKDMLTYGQIKDGIYGRNDLGEYPEHIQEQYLELCDTLDAMTEETEKKGLHRAEQYAIQNWLIHVQSALVRDVTETFVEQIDLIMHGEFHGDLFEGRLAGLVLDSLGNLAYNYVFTSRMIVSLEVAADAVISGLLDKFIPASINYDTDNPLSPVESRIMSLVSDNYKHSYHHHAEGRDEAWKLYLRLLLITDYICGMTDGYARDLFHKLNGN